jgi:hypothetical protein
VVERVGINMLCASAVLCIWLQGNTLPGWPVQMGEVQGQVLVADLNADGNMELFVGEWQQV